MDEENVIGIQRMREINRHHRFNVDKECDAYKKALEDITKADTAGQMLAIAYRVLEENRK
jgi:dsDNA-binding SOS-regulon protein